MVQINITYENNLRCKAIHEPSGTVLLTDAPKDNQGNGESFSPTDLLATALGTCMLTTMGIFARRNNLDIAGSTVSVQKEMIADPARRIGKLTVEFHCPAKFIGDERQRLQNAAMTCPVHKSLRENVEIPVNFFWDR